MMEGLRRVAVTDTTHDVINNYLYVLLLLLLLDK